MFDVMAAMSYMIRMSRFDHAFDAPEPSTLGVSGIQSVQSSLYLRLRKTYGNKSGTMGWLLVRLAQPEHADHQAAFDALSSRPQTLGGLLRIARATLASPNIASKPAARDVAGAVVSALEVLTASSQAAPGLAR